jgi:hypothetical protein
LIAPIYFTYFKYFNETLLTVNRQLQQSFQEFEAQRHEILSWIGSLSESQLHQHHPGKWSIAQIISHLIASERLSVNYLNKKIQAIDTLRNSTWLDALKMNVLILSQRLPLKYKAPRVIVENTQVYENAHTLISRWDQVRKELETVLEKFQDGQLRRKVFRHPVAGRLNIRQMMRFLREHIIHHTPQIKRRLKQK